MYSCAGSASARRLRRRLTSASSVWSLIGSSSPHTCWRISSRVTTAPARSTSKRSRANCPGLSGGSSRRPSMLTAASASSSTRPGIGASTRGIVAVEAGSSNSIWHSPPRLITSPERRRRGLCGSIRWRLTYVPLVLPRSVMVTCSWAKSRRACSRETPVSSSTRLQSRARPMVNGNSLSATRRVWWAFWRMVKYGSCRGCFSLMDIPN